MVDPLDIPPFLQRQKSAGPVAFGEERDWVDTSRKRKRRYVARSVRTDPAWRAKNVRTRKKKIKP